MDLDVLRKWMRRWMDKSISVRQQLTLICGIFVTSDFTALFDAVADDIKLLYCHSQRQLLWGVIHLTQAQSRHTQIGKDGIGYYICESAFGTRTRSLKLVGSKPASVATSTRLKLPEVLHTHRNPSISTLSFECRVFPPPPPCFSFPHSHALDALARWSSNGVCGESAFTTSEGKKQAALFCAEGGPRLYLAFLLAPFPTASSTLNPRHSTVWPGEPR